jgi:hypothetical protein
MSSSLLQIAGTDKALRGAALKTKDEAAKGRQKNAPQARNYTLYNLPDEWIRLISADGMKIATYARVAILEKLRRDGRIS